jgi:hypothetical protein
MQSDWSSDSAQLELVFLRPCAVVQSLIQWASLRGLYALLDSTLPPLLRSIRLSRTTLSGNGLPKLS